MAARDVLREHGLTREEVDAERALVQQHLLSLRGAGRRRLGRRGRGGGGGHRRRRGEGAVVAGGDGGGSGGGGRGGGGRGRGRRLAEHVRLDEVLVVVVLALVPGRKGKGKQN